jgi:hypothetical protein
VVAELTFLLVFDSALDCVACVGASRAFGRSGSRSRSTSCCLRAMNESSASLKGLGVGGFAEATTTPDDAEPRRRPKGSPRLCLMGDTGGSSGTWTNSFSGWEAGLTPMNDAASRSGRT